MFSVSNVTKGAKNSFGSYPTKFVGSTQNHEKMIETPNHPIKMKKFPKKTMFRILKLERSQKYVWELTDRIFSSSIQRP
jgi:hypothetical protein